MSPSFIFWSFWWLIFPIMGFAFGGFGMFMRHRHNQKALDILKAYVDQGKDPPPEVLRAVYGQADPGPAARMVAASILLTSDPDPRMGRVGAAGRGAGADLGVGAPTAGARFGRGAGQSSSPAWPPALGSGRGMKAAETLKAW
jgi:hypothetical protein